MIGPLSAVPPSTAGLPPLGVLWPANLLILCAATAVLFAALLGIAAHAPHHRAPSEPVGSVRRSR